MTAMGGGNAERLSGTISALPVPAGKKKPNHIAMIGFSK